MIKCARYCCGFFFLLFLLISCSNKEQSASVLKTGPQLELRPTAKKILEDTTSFSPTVDSLRKEYRKSGDTAQIILLSELSEYWSPEAFTLVDEALYQSRKKSFAFGEADALCRLGIYYYRHSKPDSADIVLEKALTMGRQNNWKKIIAQALSLKAEVLRQKGQFDKVHELHAEAMEIAKEIDDKKRLAFCLISKAEAYRTTGQFEKAFDCYFMSINYSSKIGDVNRIATCYNSMGDIYRIKGDFVKALDYFNKGLDLARKNVNKLQVAYGLNSMGDIYNTQKEYNKALIFYNEGIQVALETGNKFRVANMYASMGNSYEALGNVDMALEYFNRSVKISEEMGYYDNLAFALSNIGGLFSEKGDYSKALEYFKQAYEIAAELENSGQVSDFLYSMSECYFKINDLAKAKDLALKSMDIAKEKGLIANIRNAAKILSNIYQVQRDYLNALNMSNLFIAMKDSVSNDENIKQFAAVEFKAKEEKLKAEQMAKEQMFKAERARKEEELKRQKVIRYAFTIGFGLVLMLAIVIYRGLRINKQQNKIITAQKKEVEHQKELVEEKNKEITDSITYAKRLQEAILPPVKIIKQFFPESFVLYKPKDIIAGDFYWMEKIGDTIFFAAADSTGHGVPGAMVSVVCSNALNRAVKEFGLKEPGKILDKTRELVIETFEKSEGDVKDGMDISLITITKASPENISIKWSGANNPLWYTSDGKISEIKATKQPIGKSDNPQPFATHEINYEKNTVFYLLTDGYADQFGGEKGKKFKYKQLEELILKNSHTTLSEQEKLLDNAFMTWKGSYDQVDDVTIIGIKL